LPIEVSLKPGFNMVAVGQKLVDTYSSGSSLTLPREFGPNIDKAMQYDSKTSTFHEADLTGGDFALQQGAGLVLYAQEAGTIKVADSGEETTYSFQIGSNHIGLLSVPFGYRAYDLLNSIGLENIQSVRRFDNETGLWRTASVRTSGEVVEIVGENFAIKPGDGLVVTMKQIVEFWQP
jgi:hypothetical protein